MLRRLKDLHSLRFLFGVIAVVLCIDSCSLYAKSTGTTILQKTETSQSATPSLAKQDVSVKKNSNTAQVVEQKKSNVRVAQSPASGKSKLSLDQIYALSVEKKSGQIPTRSQSITPAQKGTDLYTQSQAHMSVAEIKKLIAATYDTKPYQKLIDTILNREKEYADHYVFYHGTDNVWRVPQDLYTRLYAHFNKISPDRMKDFIFLRFNGLDDVAINNLLIAKLKEAGLINDHAMGNDLLSVDLALFGNVGTQPECTWQYFVKSRGHTNPTRAIYEMILNKFGLSHKYIDELMTLADLYQTKEQTILQVFIPKNKVDKIGYLAWIRGIPSDQELMHKVLRDVQDKKFEKTAPALDHYARVFKQEQEKNPIFKGLVERLNTKEFSLDYFLTFYRNRPEDIEDINIFQARLFLTHEILLNPLSGVKIFRCSTATAMQLQKYNEKFDVIVKKMVDEKQ